MRVESDIINISVSLGNKKYALLSHLDLPQYGVEFSWFISLSCRHSEDTGCVVHGQLRDATNLDHRECEDLQSHLSLRLAIIPNNNTNQELIEGESLQEVWRLDREPGPPIVFPKGTPFRYCPP